MRRLNPYPLTVGLVVGIASASEYPLGLPAVPTPVDNPQTPAKVALGEKLFNDERFSSTGKVACATCHDAKKAFTDGPLSVSAGIDGKTGTRNAPTVVNAAYGETMFWDGRSPSLEDQSLHPFVNPVEMGLADHEPILAVIRDDAAYKTAFKTVFDVKPDAITMDHVTKAIAAFERTVVAGDSPFDRWFYGGDQAAMTDAQKRGYDVFVGRGRCQSCHVIEQTQATFTDNRFHNVGVGINGIQTSVPELVGAYRRADLSAAQVDAKVLSDPRTSELGRFAVTHDAGDIGAFKTPTVRNVALTAPYMHDGSLKTLREVLDHYNNGGVAKLGDPVNDFLSGGIRPLALTEAELVDLEAFLNALTSPKLPAQVVGGAR